MRGWPTQRGDSARAMSALCPDHWDDAQAELYAQTIAQSGYADAVVPLLGGPFADVLDIGAGSGELTHRVLSDGARWSAVEPQPAMQRRLHAQRPSLAPRGIELLLYPQTWQALPCDMVAHTVLAANVGATHHEAARFFDAMRPRAQKNMLWVVAAQHGPSTFLCSGIFAARYEFFVRVHPTRNEPPDLASPLTLANLWRQIDVVIGPLFLLVPLPVAAPEIAATGDIA